MCNNWKWNEYRDLSTIIIIIIIIIIITSTSKKWDLFAYYHLS